MTPEQCRGARGVLDWSQEDLAQRSGLAARTVRYFEKSMREPTPANLAAMKAAFQRAGIVFIPENGGGPGVRLKKRAKR